MFNTSPSPQSSQSSPSYSSIKPNTTVFFIENNAKVQRAEVKAVSGSLYYLKMESGSGLALKRHRLFITEDEALASLTAKENSTSQYESYQKAKRGILPYDIWA